MKNNGRYVLNDQGEPVPEPDLLKWAGWFETGNKSRRVARDVIGETEVSTVFLGLDHSFGREYTPVLWETQVSGGPLDQEQNRCSGTRADALLMHQRMVERVKGTL